MGALTFVKRTDPFNPNNRNIERLPFQGQTLSQLKKAFEDQFFNHPYIKAINETPDTKITLVFTINGLVVKETTIDSIQLKPGDFVTVVPKIEGDDILSTLATIAVAVIAIGMGQWYATPLTGSFLGMAGLGGSLFGGALITTGIMMIGGILISSLMPTARPEIEISSSFDTSQTYSFSPQTLQAQGAPVAFVYGIHKVYGNVIATHTETQSGTSNQILNVLICLGLGPVSKIYNLKINDQNADGYDGVESHIRLGYINQEIIPNFNDTISQYPLNYLIEYNNPYIYTTVGNTFNALEVEITFPNGLYYMNNNGGLDPITIRIAIYIRKNGSSDPWMPIANQVETVQAVATTNYWSFGNWEECVIVFDPVTGFSQSEAVWSELMVGTTEPGAHQSGIYDCHFVPSYGAMWGLWRWISREDNYTTQTRSSYIDITGAQSEAIIKSFRYNITSQDIAYAYVYPLDFTTDYVKATSKYSTSYEAHFACDLTKSLVDAALANCWMANAASNQRFHIDLGSAKIIKRLYYENYHDSGGNVDRGANAFVLMGSNDAGAFADTEYNHDTNWTTLTCSQNTFDVHAESSTPDPKFIDITNNFGYRYIAIKIGSNHGDVDYMGLRRIVVMIAMEELEGAYDIKVERLTPQYTGIRYGQEMRFTNVREIYEDDFTYPRSSLMAFKALASGQLSGSFKASAIVEGRIIRYYDGANWQIGYNNNPAWVCMDILTQPVLKDDLSGVWRYDGYNPTTINTATFYAWAQFCDTLVDDGKGGTEKRFEFNGVFDTTMTMWEAALKVASSAMASLIWDGNTISVVIDTVTTPTQMFTVGNIVQDSFKITYLPMQDRAAELEANFTNIEKDYERDTFSLVNPNITTLNNKVSLDLFGLVKPSEVWRILNHQLLCNEKLKRTIEIDVDVEAVVCQIGDVVLVQHDVPLWGDGGTIVSATSNTVTLDKEVTLVAGHSYGIVVRLNDDTLVTKTIITAAGAHTILTISGTFDSVPNKYDIFYLYDIEVDTKSYRVIGFTLNEDQKVHLILQQYDETIYTGASTPYLPDDSSFSAESKYVLVSGMTAANRAFVDESGVVKRSIYLTYTISTNPYFDSVEIYYKKEQEGQWTFIGKTLKNFYLLENVSADTTYFIRAVGVSNMNGVKLSQLPSSDNIVSITTESLADFYNTALQERVTGLQIFGQGNDTIFTGKDCKFVWSDIQAIDVVEGAGEEQTGAGYTLPPLWFKDYQVIIKNTDGTTRRTDYTVLPEYIYSYERNYEDGNGVPTRSFKIEVRARDRYFRVSAIAACLLVENTAPAAVTGVTIEEGVGCFIITIPPVTISDIDGYFTYVSQTDGFIPSEANKVNSGPDTRIVFNPIRAGTWYVKVAAYDTFDRTTLNYSEQFTFVMPIWLESSDIELEFMKMSFQSISWAQFAIFDGFADETKRLSPDTSTYLALINKNSLIQGDATPNRTFGFLSKVYNNITTIESGTSTGVGLNYLTDSNKSWFTDECKGLTLVDSALTEFLVISNTADTLTISGTPVSGVYSLKEALPTTMVPFCNFMDSTEGGGYGYVKLEVSFNDGINWETVLDTESAINLLEGNNLIDNPGVDYCVRISLKNDGDGNGPIVYKFLICTDPSPWRF